MAMEKIFSHLGYVWFLENLRENERENREEK